MGLSLDVDGKVVNFVLRASDDGPCAIAMWI